jgi:hypothetical protein
MKQTLQVRPNSITRIILFRPERAKTLNIGEHLDHARKKMIYVTT